MTDVDFSVLSDDESAVLCKPQPIPPQTSFASLETPRVEADERFRRWSPPPAPYRPPKETIPEKPCALLSDLSFLNEPYPMRFLVWKTRNVKPAVIRPRAKRLGQTEQKPAGRFVPIDKNKLFGPAKKTVNPTDENAETNKSVSVQKKLNTTDGKTAAGKRLSEKMEALFDYCFKNDILVLSPEQDDYDYVNSFLRRKKRKK